MDGSGERTRRRRARAGQLEDEPIVEPPLYALALDAVPAARRRRATLLEPLAVSALATDRTITGGLTARVFTPRDVRGVYLHLHGGGWAFGSSHFQDDRLEALARACRVAVVSVEYRLAPEHPYPAGPDDCEAAALWLCERSCAEFGVDRLLIGGESAGAHLAVLTLLRLRDRHGLTPFGGANLAYGFFDLGLTPSARRHGEYGPAPTTRELRWLAAGFAPRRRRRAPSVSPLYADLTGLPDALFMVGTLDPLLDDTLLMCARWREAGNGAELAVYPEAGHGFDDAPRAHAFLRSRLSP